MTAILIGVGGLGGEIVYQADRQIQERLARTPNAPAAQHPAAHVQCFLLDTRREDFHQEFDPSHVFLVPRVAWGINNLVSNLCDGAADPFFPRFWPEPNGRPYLPGDFDHGAGQIRLKGKLAYRLHLTDRTPIVDAIDNAAKSMHNALGPAALAQNPYVDLFIVGSLGGGTSSGIAHALALHLGERLQGYCRVHGAFLLADITSLKTSPAEQKHVEANTWADLGEMDWYQRDDEPRALTLTPYLAWPGAGNQIDGQRRAFRIIYLFSRTNREQLTLDSADQYVRLVAECLVSEVFSPISDHLEGPASQFGAKFNNQAVLEGRSATYAAAGCATVAYPTHRITRHLGRRLATRTLAVCFTDSGKDAADAWANGAAAAQTYLAHQQLLREGGRSLLSRLHVKPATETAMSPQPALSESEAKYRNAGQSDVQGVIDKRRDAFDVWLTGQFGPVLTARAAAIRNSYLSTTTPAPATAATGADEERPPSLLDLIEQELAAGGALGFIRARGAAAALVAELKQQSTATQQFLHGPSWPQPGKPGAVRKLEHHRTAIYKTQLNALHDGFGLFSKNGQAAKARFIDQWWRPFAHQAVELAVNQEALAIYEALLVRAEQLQAALNDLHGEISGLARGLEQAATTDLGASYQGGVLEVGVLDDPALVDARFGQLVIDRFGQAGPGLAESLITGAPGVRSALRELVKIDRANQAARRDTLARWRADVGNAFVRTASRYFTEDVEQRTVWDALYDECELRQQLKLIDVELEAALKAWQQHEQQLAQQGHIAENQADFVAEHFIQNRLMIGYNRAAPFWQMDQVARSKYGHVEFPRPFPLTMIAYTGTAYQDFGQRHPALADLVGGLQIDQREAADIDLPHEIVIYRREGAVPLFFLDAGMRAALNQAGQAERHIVGLFTDRRFPDELAGDHLEEPIPAAANIRYAVAAAVYFGLLDLAASPSNTDGHLVMSVNGSTTPRQFASLDELGQALLADPALARDLARHINAQWDRVEDARRRSTMRAMANQIEETANRTTDPADRAWWEGAVRVIRQREYNGRYTISR